MKLVSFDPGETTGVALLSATEDQKLVIHSVAEYRKVELFERLSDLLDGCDLVVCEEFLIRVEWVRRGAFDNSRLETLRVIGAIEFAAFLAKLKVHYQSPSVKSVGYAWVGQKNRHAHAMDAVVHGNYYLRKRRLVKAP